MPRHARLRLAGIPVHLIQRGNNRCACFLHDRDYRVYLACLTSLSREFACAVHAFVLMTNHVHLLLTPRESEGVSRLMKHLGQRYVQYFNRRHGRTGTLWEGRYRSCLVDSERYLLACYRYIELNPVRAGLVAHPRDYTWSSHLHNAEGAISTLLVPHDVYHGLGRSHSSRCAAYRELLASDLDPAVVDELRSATNANVALGSARFHSEVEKAVGRPARRGTAGRPRKRPAELPQS
jgi:putative transposase